MFLVGQYDSRFVRRVAIVPGHCDLAKTSRSKHRAQNITWRARDKPNPRIMTLKHSNPVGSDRQVKPPRCQI